MAAVIELRTARSLDSTGSVPAQPSTPHLRVIHGGRSERARHMRRVYLLRRVAAAVVVLVFATAIVQLGRIGFAGGDPVAGSPSTIGARHVVKRGDTLWELAQAVDPTADPRDVVDQIIELNRDGRAVDPSGLLRAGEIVRLPANG